MAQNYADKETDKRLAEMENYLRSLYSKAAKEVGEAVKDYFEKLPKRYVKEFEAFQNGEYTVEQFAAWFNSQIGRGERWKSLKDNLAKQAVKANEKAAEYVNGNTTEIYTMNANYTAYEIEKAVNVSGKSMGVSFDLVDESTVKRLFTGKNHTEFRTLSVNRKRDYEWNFKKAQNSILSSILQGKDMNGIAKSLFQDVMHNNQTAAIRNARTAVTSAQNGGRLDTYLAAQAQGLSIQKEWICTHDDRTRQSHLNLDGVRVGINEEFPNGCKYPGDPDGAPAEVYNCRCTMRSVIAGYDQEKAHETGNTAESYKEWLKGKEFKPNDKSDDYMSVFNKNKTERFNLKSSDGIIKAKKVTDSKSGFYVSNKVKVSNKTLKKMDEAVSSAMEMTGAKNSNNKPNVVITTHRELLRNKRTARYGTHDPVTNTVYLSKRCFSRKATEYLMPNDPRKTALHELFHWDTAEEFRSIYGDITKDNIGLYKEFANENGKRVIAINSDIDARNISSYAAKAVTQGKYSEVGTEIKTYNALKGEKK